MDMFSFWVGWSSALVVVVIAIAIIAVITSRR